MACSKRDRTGSCAHFQCPFSEGSGYECVDIYEGNCEVTGCLERCPYNAELPDPQKMEKAIRFALSYKELPASVRKCLKDSLTK